MVRAGVRKGGVVKSAMAESSREVSVGGLLGWWGRTRVFLAQVRNEVERVTWPTWKEVQATTFVVMLFSLVFGLYLWGIDLVVDRLARGLFSMFGAS